VLSESPAEHTLEHVEPKKLSAIVMLFTDNCQVQYGMSTSEDQNQDQSSIL